MKTIKSKKTLYKLIVAFLIIVTLMGTVPNISYAETDTDGGGSIFNPFLKMIASICDGVMQFMQKAFVSSENIAMGDGRYKFQYSPAVIFSGNVKSFDINFINPDTEIKETYNYDKYFESKLTEYKSLSEWSSETEYYNKLREAKEKNTQYRVFSEPYVNSLIDLVEGTIIIYYEENGILYIEYFNYTYMQGQQTYRHMTKTENIASLGTSVKTTYKSIANQLQPTIATWYKALKRIALVGLLSVLVYLGIRIVISSLGSKDSSKYKKMLTNWLIAICMLFTLHYIMNATIVIVKNISNIFDIGTTDILIQQVREEIEQSPSWGTALANVVIYAALTIYTILFSFQYLKRVLYMAFFTLIAPLITLTYPLDKVKDGQAQAFTLWIREYVFNALIQVIHLVAYFIFIESAINLAKSFPLYAIIVIMFMEQGEKIIRNMFGFNNVETVGTVQAAAVGGLASQAWSIVKNLSKGKKK